MYSLYNLEKSKHHVINDTLQLNTGHFVSIIFLSFMFSDVHVYFVKHILFFTMYYRLSNRLLLGELQQDLSISLFW